jgi:translation initiation factor IF-3
VKKQNKSPVNNGIRSLKVRLIDEAGAQMGILDREKALEMSRERNLDLVQVTEKIDPPVCKIMDYGKYLYQQEKKQKQSKKKTGGELKGIRLTYNISDHDMETRAKVAEKFLKEGNKIRIEMRLRGREKALQDFARQKIGRFLEILGKSIPYKIEKEIKKEPRGLTMIIAKG